jgi:septum formation protein
MINTTLIYLEKDGAYLMLHRIKKKEDLNEGKWIGVGGKMEADETPLLCAEREVFEETGLIAKHLTLRGVVDFRSDKWGEERMYLFTGEEFTGELHESDEGVLRWIPKDQVTNLNLWEGDRIFFRYLDEGEAFFHLTVQYEGDHLVYAFRSPRIVLASGSPRRKELLEQIGLVPEVIPSRASEVIAEMSPAYMVEELSHRKAQEVSDSLPVKGISPVVIGADTIVCVDGQIAGKPKSHQEAAAMIRRMAGKSHEVYTGVTVICGSAKRTFSVKTVVHVSKMTEAEIAEYAMSGEPMDKAGAYGIQGRFGAYITGIEGDYFNVVGLPLSRLYQTLTKMRLLEPEVIVDRRTQAFRT